MKWLNELREMNCGYNPEPVDESWINDESEIALVVDGMVYELTPFNAQDEAKYIRSYPRRYGVIYRGMIWGQSA